MRKRIDIYTRMLFASLILLCGCSGDLDERLSKDASIHILPSISLEGETRMAGPDFEPSDRIGIYVIPYQADNATPGTFPQDAHESNIEYIYNGANWTPTAHSYPKWPGESKADIYGYYPYNDEPVFESGSGEYWFSVEADQRTLVNHIQSDFLWGKSEGLSPTRNVQLTFYHQMSLVGINVRAEQGVSINSADIEVSLVNINPTVLISMSDGKITTIPSGNDTEIQTLSLATPQAGYLRSFQGIIPPQSIGFGTRFIRVKAGNINHYYQPSEDLVLESGKQVTFNITITQRGLNVFLTYINQWQNGGSIDSNLDQKAPWVFDLNTINWEQSLIHNITRNSVPIARVCKEYIYNNSSVDAQAIVVYPINAEGKSDLTRGFVAQVMNRNANSTTGVYEPNSSNIHGGSVNFDITSNKLLKYTPGTSTLINKIEINSNGNAVQANDNAIPLLDTEPVVMTDIDNNSYPIVKIGTQYWTAKNYHAEHFRNGDALPFYYFNDNRSFKPVLGALYTWDTIIDSRGFAPNDWQVPGEPDWQSVYRYLTPSAGMKLKAATMWASLTYADNVTGFSGLPGGRRTNTGTYNEINSYGQWWSSTPTGTNSAYRLYLTSGALAMTLGTLETNYTQSVRLLKKTPL